MATKVRKKMTRIRWTAEELAIAKTKAKEEGFTLAAYLRQLALTVRTEADRKKERAERVKRAIAAIGSLSDEEAESMLDVVRDR